MFLLGLHGGVLVVLLLVLQESLVDALAQSVDVGLVVQIVFLGAGGDITQLYQTGWHGGLTENEEGILLYAFVGTACRGTYILLNHLCQLHALGHEALVEHFEDDVALGGTWVKACIVLLVVFLDEHHLVLAHGGTELLATAAKAHGVGFQSRGRSLAGYGIGMHGDKDIGFVLVGDVSPLVKGDEHIGLAGIDDPHVRAVFLYIAAERQRHIQIDVLLVGILALGSGILAAMSGIYHQREPVLLGSSGSDK